MKKIIKYISLVLAVVFMAAFSGCGGSGKINYKHKITLGDNGDLITNQGMGWNFTYYSNQMRKFNCFLTDEDPYLDDFGCNIAYIRIGWSFIQPDKAFYDAVLKPAGITIEDENTLDGDHFHWEVVDKVAKPWIERGKQVAFRIVLNDGWEQSAPLWLKDKGVDGVEWDPCFDYASWSVGDMLKKAKDTDAHKVYDEATGNTYTAESMYAVYNAWTDEGKTWYTSLAETDADAKKIVDTANKLAYGGGRKTWVPQYSNDTLVACYKKLMEAIRDRYTDFDGDGITDIAFVDVGSLGTWGEGNWSRSALTEKYLNDANYGGNVCRTKHFTMMHEVFKDSTFPVLAGDDVLTHGATDEDKALAKSFGFGCSDDSLECDTAWTQKASTIAQEFGLEGHYVALESGTSRTPGTPVLQSIFEANATFVRLNCDPEQAKKGTNKDGVADGFGKYEEITKYCGYRIVFTQAETSNLQSGKEFGIKFTLRNDGSAKCFIGGLVAVTILDESGKEITSFTSDFNVKQLDVVSDYDQVGTAETKTCEIKMDIPTLKAGKYSVNVSVVSEDGKVKRNLPLADGYNGLYRIATFDLQEK